MAHLTMLMMHILGAMLAILIGPFQFLPGIRKGRWLKVHRWLGRTYLLSILFGGLSGLYMAQLAYGGSIARLGFTSLASLWLFSGYRAYKHIRSKETDRHREWMTRNYALTFAAVALRLEFVGARPDALVQGEGKGPVINLLTGGRENWRTGLPSYPRLVYTDLWPGIDLALIGDIQRVKYELRVKPGADPGQIRLRYRGGDALRLESSGELAVDTPLGTLHDEPPFSFQESDGARAEVRTKYALKHPAENTFGFALAGYDRTKPLIIDPADRQTCGSMSRDRRIDPKEDLGAVPYRASSQTGKLPLWTRRVKVPA